jgi:diacylglycerol kinase family enzyme
LRVRSARAVGADSGSVGKDGHRAERSLLAPTRLRQLSALACGLVRYDPDVTIEAAEWVRVESDTRVPVQVDGEILGTLPAMIKLHPERLQIIFPRDP